MCRPSVLVWLTDSAIHPIVIYEVFRDNMLLSHKSAAHSSSFEKQPRSADFINLCFFPNELLFAALSTCAKTLLLETLANSDRIAYAGHLGASIATTLGPDFSRFGLLSVSFRGHLAC